jgi:MerR family transcriptional regulator, light-induced transcriptional regulator
VLRIGELSRRVGVSDHVLRAWESRYGLLKPERSAGGFRLYSEADVLRIRRMQAHLTSGLAPAEAAHAVLEADREAAADAGRGADASRAADAGRAAVPGHVVAAAGELSAALRQAFDTFDESAAQAVLDRLVSDLSLAAMLREVVMPYLAELGRRWEQGTASIAQEHFASNVIRGRLAGLARGWGSGHGPRAVLACPPGELHDLALMAFGIVLNRNGWKIDYLGINTPVEELDRAVDTRAPGLVVVAATLPESLEPLTGQLTRLARRVPLVLAGPGATPQLAGAVRARLLNGDPVTAAENIRWPLRGPSHEESA